ncbi:MAG: hypothetical protein DME18_11070 [Verrucomicrobia bacterium]|nr:MAG: hypothetical protein DME18_11070 [Verrucomicrobiota bacterium]
MKTNSSALIIPAPSSATNAAGTNALAGDIRDIKAPVEIPSGWIWLACLSAALAAAAVSWFAWRYWRKHHAKTQAQEIIVPPHERARRKLQQALKLIYEPQPFCIMVSNTLRTYLEEAFSLRAPERTTEEFLVELQSSALLSLTQKQSLADFLMRCDLVKFARDEPTVERLKELHESALRLVDETSYFQPPTESVPAAATPAPDLRPPQPPLPESPSKDSAAEQQSSIAHHHSSIS